MQLINRPPRNLELNLNMSCLAPLQYDNLRIKRIKYDGYIYAIFTVLEGCNGDTMELQWRYNALQPGVSSGDY